MRLRLLEFLLGIFLLVIVSDDVRANIGASSPPASSTQSSDAPSSKPSFGEQVLDGLLEHGAVVVAIALILLVAAVFRRFLLRVINNLWPIQLHSDWQTTIDRGSGKQDHEIVKLTQIGPLIWGTATTKTEPLHIYKLRGRIHGNNIRLTYREAGAVDMGAAMLKIHVDKSMDGFEIGIDGKADAISVFKYTWAPLPAKGH